MGRFRRLSWSSTSRVRSFAPPRSGSTELTVEDTPILARDRMAASSCFERRPLLRQARARAPSRACARCGRAGRSLSCFVVSVLLLAFRSGRGQPRSLERKVRSVVVHLALALAGMHFGGIGQSAHSKGPRSFRSSRSSRVGTTRRSPLHIGHRGAQTSHPQPPSFAEGV